MTLKDRYARYERAGQRKKNWETTYEDALAYAAQNRETFSEKSKGSTQYDNIFDSTAQNSLMKFASNLQSGLVPPFKKWANLVPGAEIPDQAMEVAAQQLEAITETMFKYIHNSNFDTQISESFIDLGVGTGALLVNDGTDANPLNFVAVPLSEIFLEEGPNGSVKTVFRIFKMPYRNIKQTWAKAKLPTQEAGGIKEDKDVEILESTIYNPENDNYEYTVDLIDTGSTIIEEVKNVSPWVIFRWATMPGEIYGRGPMLAALPDVKTLNKTVEYLLKSSALKMIPTFLAADDGVLNPYNIKVEPGAIIPTASFGPGGPPLRALEVGGDMNLSQFIIDRMQSRIEDMMFTNPLGDVNLPVKTATEISLRQQELANRIGSSFGRLQFEFIAPLINRILDILEGRGLLPISLQDIKIDGKVISIKHQSPLSQAQDAEELSNTLRYVETLGGVVGQQLLPLFVNMDVFSKLMSDNLGLKTNLVPDKQQREEAVALMAQVSGLAQQGQPTEGE